MNEQKLIEKVKKLLALAGNNSNEAEANSAYLKAQKLIAEYSLDLSKEEGHKVEIIMMKAKHICNSGFRSSLASTIAQNFRVKVFREDRDFIFFGHKEDVEVAVEVYNHACRYCSCRGEILERRARELGESTKGVACSYHIGFVKGVEDALAEQCKALMLITPEDVEEAWSDKVKGMRTVKSGTRLRGTSLEAYNKGLQEGREHMSSTKSLEA